jgi:hypothetical protein
VAFNKIGGGLNVEPLKKAVSENPNLWGQIPFRLYDDSPHRESSDIWIKCQDIKKGLETGNFSYFADDVPIIWYPASQELPEAFNLIGAVSVLVESIEIGVVLITHLPPGGKIYKHKDTGFHAENYDKYFIPINNKDGAKFCFDSGDIEPQEGDVWAFDNNVDHWVENNSDEERIALIVCIRQNKYDRRGILCRQDS